MNTELFKIVESLTELGISLTLHSNNGNLIAEFEDGFYKSDGLAYLSLEDGIIYLNARYNEKVKVDTIQDIIECSKGWYEFSKDRYDGWAVPPSHWAKLYTED